jgi:hypothetical protein
MATTINQRKEITEVRTEGTTVSWTSNGYLYTKTCYRPEEAAAFAAKLERPWHHFVIAVCGQALGVWAQTPEIARRKARRHYIDHHDWFASDDPWGATRDAEVIGTR